MPANDASLTRLRDAGVDRVILDGADLTPREEQFTPAQPFVVRGQPGTTTAVGSDPGLQRLLEGDDPPALRAQRFLAGLSVVALEQPNTRRGVVVLEPDDWNASSALLESALAGLTSDHPLLEPLTVDDLIGTVPPAANGNTPVDRELAPSPVPPTPVTEREYLDAETELDAFNVLVPPPNPVAEPGNRSLLVSLSSAWSGPSGRSRARAELAKIDADVSQFVSRLRVPAVNSTITLTAEKGQIPVTFLNETGQALRVRVHLDSDKLVFPDGDQRILDLPPRQHDRPLHRRDPQLGDLPPHAQRDLAGRRLAHPADRGAGAHHVLREQRRRVPHDRGRALPRRVVGPRHPAPPAAACSHAGTPGARFAACDPRRRAELRAVSDAVGAAGQRSTSLLRSSAIVGLGTALSRITGFLRVAAIAYALGVGALAATYNYANETPNIALRAAARRDPHRDARPAVRPSRRARRRRGDQRHHDRRDRRCSSRCHVLGVLLAPYIVAAVHPAGRGREQGGAAGGRHDLLRLFMPQIVFYGFTALATAMLNAHRRFAAAAFAPMLNNIVVIAIFVSLPRLLDGPITLASGPRRHRARHHSWGSARRPASRRWRSLLGAALRWARIRLRFVFAWRHRAVARSRAFRAGPSAT